jgi:hypothetical protein
MLLRSTATPSIQRSGVFKAPSILSMPCQPGLPASPHFSCAAQQKGLAIHFGAPILGFMLQRTMHWMGPRNPAFSQPYFTWLIVHPI